MNRMWSVVGGLLLCGIMMPGGVAMSHGQTRVTNEEGAYSFLMPEGYYQPQEASGTSVTIKKQGVLSSLVPTITLVIMSEKDAMDRYGELDATLRKARYNRAAGMRMLKKSSLKTIPGITGWELNYVQKDRSGVPSYNTFALLERGNEQMLVITGSVHQDNRSAFGVLCDALINSIEYGP